MNRWNKADTILLIAVSFFSVALALKKFFPNEIFVNGFLFVTEAALVGGIADWFAVTALFKKPLGFPFHTAILPSRKDDFIEASVKIVQQEFFSRKNIADNFAEIRLDLKLKEYLNRATTQKYVVKEIFNITQKIISEQNTTILAKNITNKLRRLIQNISTHDLLDNFSKMFWNEKVEREIFIVIIGEIRKKIDSLEIRLKIQEILEKYAEQRTHDIGSFSILMTGLAQMLDLVNFKEAAQLIHNQLLKFIDELVENESLQNKTLVEIRRILSEMKNTSEFKDLAELVQIDISKNLPLESTIEEILKHLKEQVVSIDPNTISDISQKPLEAADKNFGFFLINIFSEEYDEFLKLLDEESKLKNISENFLNELTNVIISRTQPLVGTVTKNTLEQLTEEQLNEMVYDKAEKDFIWIRLNGSIVGSIIGLVIFAVSSFYGLKM